MAREHSIKVIGLAIEAQEDKERELGLKWTSLCHMM